MKNIGAILIVLVLGVSGLIWLWQSQTEKKEGNRMGRESTQVIATFYPLQQFGAAVVGDQGKVETIVPAGVEPHEYEPSALDIRKIYDADLFLLNGAGLDPWAEKIIPELQAKGVSIIILSESAELLPGTEEEHGEEAGHEDEESHDEESEWDPHFWLDPMTVGKGVEKITASLGERFPEKKGLFEVNRDNFLGELKDLDQEYRTGLSSCRLNTVITTHNAFSYLAKRYNFETLSMSGISPETEPSPRRLVELSGEMKARGIQYVLFESLVSPKVAQTLARSSGAETLTFNPIEGVTEEEQIAGKNYLSLMRDNLNTLRKALECQ